MMVVGDYCCRKRVDYVVIGDDVPTEPGTSLVIYLLGTRLFPSKNTEPFISPLLSLLRGFHGLSTVQRTEKKLGMDLAHHRFRARAASPNHLIDLGYLGRYRESLLASPLPSDFLLDADGSPS